ncbi:3-dehydroquinate synthase [Aeoliella mucimassa]|uniref:3-dehydroquinate synthase n=1 Tax=Aeoliella mucimassa TaxID=2527972 RepID=A0A518AH26_9BACT|nr:3-dehydroquinate synthase [Aeoliella mucimassa]QDU54033.1 3-dehydroquinate synthase [Aeoliella mucimassa]
MASSQTIRVNLAERSYDILIGSGTLDVFPQFMADRNSSTHVVIITDSNVDDLYADALGDSLTEQGYEVQMMVVDAGEESKSADAAIDLWETMLAEGADRGSVVAAVGGGVVGDLAGFVAATFARGLAFVQVPTTLLAQVDSSVGGKVGINLSEAKNMVGAFWQPMGVLVDVNVLGTLPAKEFAAGMAEVVKYGVIMDLDFFEYLEQNVDGINARDPEVMQKVVERCCQLKAEVVEADEREESGRRAILNYGHTFAHAFEAATEYGQLLHGEAVSMGMVCESRLAERIGLIDAAATERQVKLLEALSLPITPPELDPEEVYRLMWHDKKVADGKINFVLPTKIGETTLTSDVKSRDVLAVLEG